LQLAKNKQRSRWFVFAGKQVAAISQALDRLLDPDTPSVTIGTLEKAAAALGRQLRIELR
jgi:hypothetical protein